jgi:hypothetical protein
MARPPLKNRDVVHDSIITFRIAPGDRELLKQLVEYHAAQCSAVGTTSSESAVIRWLIREKAEVVQAIHKARELAMQQNTEAKAPSPPSQNKAPEAPAPIKRAPRKRERSEQRTMQGELVKKSSTPIENSEPSKEQLVLDALRAHVHPSLKLIRVCEVVRSLQARLSLKDIHQELMRAAEARTIELRPELIGEFLSSEDARLCPPGSRDTWFSYARFLKDEARA